MRFALLFFTALLTAAAAAHAEPPVPIGPVPDWVLPVEPVVAAKTDGAVDVRLADVQTRIDANGLHQYVHQIIRVLTPEGLAIAGTFGVAWKPGVGTARVHRALIRRDGKVIDVLGNGSAFQVLRREEGLENAQMDGVLTALMTIPDLRVGDEIETAWTGDAANPVLAGRSEYEQAFRQGQPIDRFYIRYSWPKDRSVQYRVGRSLPKPAKIAEGSIAGFVIDRTDFVATDVPAGAPTRFLDDISVAVSDFPDWRSVVAAMRPLYATASTPAVNSPLKTEIARIAAMSPEPKLRASEALKTAQRQIRYFARIDGLGGYLPQSADAVWAARSGDCKGKTALLLALLRGVGIEADAALVSADRGDGLDKALPMPGRFNHVIVRATVGGKVYWLDATRLGDRSIDTVVVPRFDWALPLTESSAAPVAVAASDPVLPNSEWRLDLDARTGIDKPAKATATGIFRGDGANELRTLMSIMPKEKRDEYLRDTWKARHDWITIERVDYRFDEDKSEAVLTMTGTGTMDWNNTGPGALNQYEANKARLGQDITPKRSDAQANAAPVWVAPRFEATRQTILLPDGGRNFSVSGGSIDSTVGSVHYMRTATLRGDRFDMAADTISHGAEISFADAKAADEATNGLFAKQLFIRLPPSVAAAQSTGRASRSKSRDANWLSGSISMEDYPPEARSAGAEGVTQVSYDIGIDGRVSACRIAQSSGSKALDDQTCALIRDRFVYDPARDAKGNPYPSTRYQRVRWQMAPGGPYQYKPYSFEMTYIVDVDGKVRDCKTVGTTPEPDTDASPCTKVTQLPPARGADGKPTAAKFTIRSSLGVELLPAPTQGASPPVPNSGNPH